MTQTNIDIRQLVQEAKQSGDFGPLLDAIPYAKFLGTRVEIRDQELLGQLVFADHIVGNPRVPALHGGAIGALLETTAIFEVLWRADTLVLPKTINITVDYLRSARPEHTWAKGVITKHGRRVVNVRASAWQQDEDRPVATANAHFLIHPVEA